MLTEETKNAFMIIELVDETREDEFHEALNELSRLIKENLGGYPVWWGKIKGLK